LALPGLATVQANAFAVRSVLYFMNVARNAGPLVLAAAVGALLGLAQVAVAEAAGILTLDADFGAGNDRVQGVQVTLVAWYCAMAVPTAAWLAGARRDRGTRAAAVPAAAAGALAAHPLVARLGGEAVRADTGTAVLLGVLLGVAGGAAVAAAPVVGRGIAAYAVLLWVAALVLTALVSPTVVYAGLVQPLGLDLARPWGSALSNLPYNLGYHLPTMLPVAVVTLVLACVVSGVTARRTGTWAAATAAGAAGPVLGAVLYRLLPDQVYLWNESASAVVLLLAGCCLPLAAGAAAVGRRLHRPDPDA
jgi:hypothetical protein